jgi:GNAT superfamily N-acetyltransferase
LTIELLSDAHDRSAFDAGAGYESLTQYVKAYASQNDRRYNTRTFVLLPAESNRVAGYYTIQVKSLKAEVVPQTEKLGGYPMPVALLARLAVDKEFQGQGFGALLLVDALKRITRVALSDVGIRAVEVDAIDDRARSFYARFGFVPLLDDARHMYLPIKTILKSRLVESQE